MSPEITITSEELRERVEDRLDRWIPDDVWNRAEPYARHKNEVNRQRHPEIDYYDNDYLVLLTADTVREAERDVVERVVMAEAGGESFEGQMLVAQCILNAAEKRGVDPSEAVVLYSYTKSRPDPTQRVKDAVAAVFDRGETVVDEPILYFYNPALVTSDFHESQIFVIEEGGHRFFAERSTR